MLVMLLVASFPALGLMLFEWTPLRVSLPLYLLGLVVSATLHTAMMPAKALPVRTGSEGLTGQPARVLALAGDEGWVRCGPETWRAVERAGRTLHSGDRVRVVDVVDLTLVVDQADREATHPAQAALRAST